MIDGVLYLLGSQLIETFVVESGKLEEQSFEKLLYSYGHLLIPHLKELLSRSGGLFGVVVLVWVSEKNEVFQ